MESLRIRPGPHSLLTTDIRFRSCSSVVVDFILKFRKAIDAARVVNILKEAAEQDRFNGLKVYPDSIIQISSTTTLSTSTVRPSSEGKIKDLLNHAKERFLHKNERRLMEQH